MWRMETYRAISEEFAIGIGVATGITMTDIKEDPDITKGPGRKRYSKLHDDIRVNRIIVDAVRVGRYRELTRKQFWLGRQHPDWSPRRVWSQAWRELAGRKGKGKENE